MPTQITITLDGVTDVNALMSAIESHISKGISLDIESSERGYHVGTQTRRNLRANIRTLAGLQIKCVDAWETLHMNGQCEHKDCPVNSMPMLEIAEQADALRGVMRDYMEMCDTLDADAGDEIVQEPDVMSSVVATLQRIMDSTNLN